MIIYMFVCIFKGDWSNHECWSNKIIAELCKGSSSVMVFEGGLGFWELGVIEW